MRAARLRPRQSREAEFNLDAPSDEFSGGTLRDHPPALKDCYTVANLLHLVQQVAAEDDSSALGGQLGNEGTDLTRSLRIETIGGLVQDNQLRSWTMAAAMPRRCFIPSEYDLNRRSAASPRWTRSRTA